MESPPGLPAELVFLIVDYLHNNSQALKACALVSRVLAARSQAYLFERIRLRLADHESETDD